MVHMHLHSRRRVVLSHGFAVSKSCDQVVLGVEGGTAELAQAAPVMMICRTRCRDVAILRKRQSKAMAMPMPMQRRGSRDAVGFVSRRRLSSRCRARR